MHSSLMSCASCRLNLVLNELVAHQDIELTNLQLTKENLNELRLNPFRNILKKRYCLALSILERSSIDELFHINLASKYPQNAPHALARNLQQTTSPLLQLANVVHFKQSTDRSAQYKIRVDNRVACVSYQPAPTDISLDDIEYTTACLVTIIKEMLGLEIDHICFCHSLAKRTLYEQRLGCAVHQTRGAAASVSISLPEDLNDEFPAFGTDGLATEGMSPSPTDGTENIASYSFKAAQRHGCKATEVAKELNMSVGGLAKRLRQSDVNFRSISRMAKMQRTLEMMRNGSPNKLIADALGYSDVCTFSRAFRSWFGMPPAEYKKTILEEKEKYGGI
ncbi:helix-turn-helix domain-containing protein [Cupriavidus sp. TMH.W2]|uniref:helix-turn-helix domain-containing protein n=1 Tax=Cupriavidus sp. TMH.W2 TaxID=3434465 RepID=UPI003D77DFBD